MARTFLVLSVISLFLTSSPAFAQRNTSSISGVVLDDAGGAIAGARVGVSDANGAVVETTTSDAAGGFLLRGLTPGPYSLLVEISLFAPYAESIVVASSEAASSPLRVVLRPGGFVEGLVVTGRRVETRLAETPQKIEVIDAADIERSVANDVTDLLKKSSSVEVIQYTGALSGIGIRGFRPQFSGINKRSLLLIDGRPSGVTNLATLLVGGVERIEVLKGAASAIYGSSAMGGVVNVITRQSQGKIGGHVQVGVGSFATSDVSGRAGGSVSSRVDFDVNGNAFDQRDDIRMGNGVTRPATSFTTYDGGGRLGIALARGWRIDGHGDLYRGRDIASPPDLAAGTIGQTSKDIERTAGDVRVTGRAGAHDLAFTAYHTDESSHTSNVTTGNPLDLPYLPYLSFDNTTGWMGMQAKDAWAVSHLSHLVIGFDYEKVTSVSRSFARTGDATAPFSADANKRTVGAYAEHTLRLKDGATIVAVGGRVDRITTETVDTPLKTNFTPSEASFTVFNPSLGIKQRIVGGLRGHFTIGGAFIPAEASQLTGFTTTVVGGRTQISQGNPDLKPERSTSLDIGAEWTSSTTRFDVTAFRTVVNDRFINNIVVSSPPPPAPLILSVANGLDAHISGLEFDIEQRLGGHVGVFGNATHYFNRKERLASGLEQDILNVAENTVRAGIDLDFGRLGTRVSGRYVQGRRDNDFNAPGFPIVTYDNFTVIDASATYRLARRHSVVAEINNLSDEFYYEKIGYPLQGASFKVGYRLGF